MIRKTIPWLMNSPMMGRWKTGAAILEISDRARTGMIPEILGRKIRASSGPGDH